MRKIEHILQLGHGTIVFLFLLFLYFLIFTFFLILHVRILKF